MSSQRFRLVLEALPRPEAFAPIAAVIAQEMNVSPSWLKEELLKFSRPRCLWQGLRSSKAIHLRNRLDQLGAKVSVHPTHLNHPLKRDCYPRTATLFEALQGTSWTAL